MTHRSLPTMLRPLRLPLIAGAACSLLLVAGCGGDSDAQAAVKQAELDFTSISLGDPNAFPAESAEIYTDTEQSLSKYAGDSDGFAEAAAVGVSMAMRGQAALASQAAVKTEGKAMRQARVIRGMINEYLTMNAIAQAAGAFDPSADIAELDSIIKLRQDDIKNYTQQMNQINAEINKYDEKIKNLRAKADDQREQAGALELQIPRVSATQAADLAKQMREFTLRADQFDLEATRLEGVVGQLRPGAKEVQLNVQKASSQIELLKKSIKELQERAQQSKADEKEAQESTAAALKLIRDAVSEYQGLRDGEVLSANQKAISLARASIKALSDARGPVKTVAMVNKSDSQQLLADLQMNQSLGEQDEAQLYLSLKDANIPGDWDTRIKDATDTAEELLKEAQQSYQNAATSLRATRPKGDASEKVQAAAARLDKLGGVAPEGDETGDGQPHDTDNNPGSTDQNAQPSDG